MHWLCKITAQMEQGQPYKAERAHGQLLGEDLIADPSDIISANNYIVNIIPVLQNIKLQNMQTNVPTLFYQLHLPLYHVGNVSLHNKTLVLRFVSFCILMNFSFGDQL